MTPLIIVVVHRDEVSNKALGWRCATSHTSFVFFVVDVSYTSVKARAKEEDIRGFQRVVFFLLFNMKTNGKSGDILSYSQK